MSSLKDVIIKLCCEICANEKIQAAFSSAVEAGLIVGGSAAVGKLLGGSLGLFTGAAVGSVIAWKTCGQFRPLPEIIMEMNRTQKDLLYSAVMGILVSLTWSDIHQLYTLVTSDVSLYELVLGVIISFTINQLKAKVKHGK